MTESNVPQNQPLSSIQLKRLSQLEKVIESNQTKEVAAALNIGAALHEIFIQRLYVSEDGSKFWPEYLEQLKVSISAKSAHRYRGLHYFTELLKAADITPLPGSISQIKPLLRFLDLSHPDAEKLQSHHKTIEQRREDDQKAIEVWVVAVRRAADAKRNLSEDFIKEVAFDLYPRERQQRINEQYDLGKQTQGVVNPTQYAAPVPQPQPEPTPQRVTRMTDQEIQEDLSAKIEEVQRNEELLENGPLAPFLKHLWRNKELDQQLADVWTATLLGVRPVYVEGKWGLPFSKTELDLRQCWSILFFDPNPKSPFPLAALGFTKQVPTTKKVANLSADEKAQALSIVKAIYKERQKQVHPNRTPGGADASSLINYAYDVISSFLERGY